MDLSEITFPWFSISSSLLFFPSERTLGIKATVKGFFNGSIGRLRCGPILNSHNRDKLASSRPKPDMRIDITQTANPYFHILLHH